MTEEEVQALKPGTRVQAKIAGIWRDCILEAVEGRSNALGVTYIVVHLRRAGRTRRGQCHRIVARYARYLRPALDPLPANVFADWLSEHGEERAAALLREAFPLCDGIPEEKR